MAMTFMRIAVILTRSIVTQILYVDSLPNGSIFARNHFNVAQFTRPTRQAFAFVGVFAL